MSKKHTIIMMVCSLIALGTAAAVFIFKVPINNIFFFLLILVCPLSHFLMMGMMGHGNHDNHSHMETIDANSINPKSSRDN